jgi:NADH-quinone oxidoreductase subunit N
LGKTVLFGAALGAGWTWLAVIMAVNVALSLFYYVRLLEALYLRGPLGASRAARSESVALRAALASLALGTIVTGVFPEWWTALASYASSLVVR